jgi:hypothetical protein
VRADDGEHDLHRLALVHNAVCRPHGMPILDRRQVAKGGDVEARSLRQELLVRLRLALPLLERLLELNNGVVGGFGQTRAVELPEGTEDFTSQAVIARDLLKALPERQVVTHRVLEEEKCEVLLNDKKKERSNKKSESTKPEKKNK